MMKIIKNCWNAFRIAKPYSGFKLYAYCLMGNHFYMLIGTEQEDLSQIFKRIGVRFVYWYIWKYRRSGHLFQDRFKSEPVEGDAHFLTVLRYIHQNPIKAGICQNLGDYKYSSYNAYSWKRTGLVDTDFALSMISLKEFIRYHHEENDDTCLEYKVSRRMTDEEAMVLINKMTGCKNASDIQRMPVSLRNKSMQLLKNNGLSIRQISRLTGISKRIV